jgi:hypothetical protein
MEIVTSWMEQGKRDLVVRQLRKRFGALDIAKEDRIDQLSSEQLEALGESLLDFASVEDLDDWLDRVVAH